MEKILLWLIMDEGRKRVLAIVANLSCSRFKTTEDLFDTGDSPRTRSMIIAAVQWAKRIIGKVDEGCGIVDRPTVPQSDVFIFICAYTCSTISATGTSKQIFAS
jgi:hypothetical protein